MAVPLGWVARLEEFPFDTIEHAGGHHVVQYRGEILPLIELRRLFGDDSSFSDSKPVSVVVYSHQGRTVGLIVDEILDIIDENILVTQKAIRHGTRGAAVIQGKVTELLDMDSLVREEFPTWEPESRHA